MDLAYYPIMGRKLILYVAGLLAASVILGITLYLILLLVKLGWCELQFHMIKNHFEWLLQHVERTGRKPEDRAIAELVFKRNAFRAFCSEFSRYKLTINV